MDTLPIEIHRHILSFLSTKQKKTMRMVYLNFKTIIGTLFVPIYRLNNIMKYHLITLCIPGYGEISISLINTVFIPYLEKAHLISVWLMDVERKESGLYILNYLRMRLYIMISILNARFLIVSVTLTSTIYINFFYILM